MTTDVSCRLLTRGDAMIRNLSEITFPVSSFVAAACTDYRSGGITYGLERLAKPQSLAYLHI